MIYRKNRLIQLYFFLVFFIGCNITPNESHHLNEATLKNEISQDEAIKYYELVSQTITDDNKTVIKVKLPKDIKIIKGWDNTIIQYEWFSNTKRNIFSIDKLESANTIKYINDNKAYHDDVKHFWENDWQKDLDNIKRVLAPFYFDVRMISFETDIFIKDRYFVRRNLYCKDSRLSNTAYENINLIEVQYITLHNKRKYMLTYRYYGGDKMK
jgi:hypothetical protein